MPLHIHELDPERDREFLEEEREDPVTGEYLQPGDRVVICAGCQSAFLEESWGYLGGQHCQQAATLPAIPVSKALNIQRNRRRFVIGTSVLERAQAWRRILAFVIDLMVAGLASIFVILPMAGLYIWFRDGLNNGQSIGKSWLGIQTLDIQTGQPCSWGLSFRRNFILGLFFSYPHIAFYSALIFGNLMFSFIAVLGLIISVFTILIMLIRMVSVFMNQRGDEQFAFTRVVQVLPVHN